MSIKIQQLLCRDETGGKTLSIINAPNGIRIHVAGLKGRCPGPLDDGGLQIQYIKEVLRRQYIGFGLSRLVQLARKALLV
jgi:hypothetical protein